VVWLRRYNKELYSSVNDVDIIKRIKINKLRLAGYFIRVKIKNYKKNNACKTGRERKINQE
jgi:hypothetical protein